jgi:hypothetical protein
VGGTDTEADDIPRVAAYMALRKEPDEVRKGSGDMRLGEEKPLPRADLHLELLRCQLRASSPPMDRNEQNSEDLEGLRRLYCMPAVR